MTNPELEKGRIEKYEVPPGEENSYHVELEKVQFDIVTGQKKSKPFVQKFDARSYLNFQKHYKNLGYTYLKVLHAPK